MTPSAEENQVDHRSGPQRRSGFGLVPFALLLGLLIILVGGRVPAAGAADESGPSPFFGILAQQPMSEDDFDTMAWGRLGSYRATIKWESVDRNGDGDMDWGAVDSLVRETAERGIELLPVFYDTPSWLAGNRRRLPIFNGYARYHWKTLLREAVDRYGTDGTFWREHAELPERPIRYWQVWNEPNIKYWAKPVSVPKYARLLGISARVIRNADPNAKVVTAGLYSRPRNGAGIRARKFIERLYRQPGFRRSFDIAAIHPYAGTTRKSVRRTFPIREVMDRFGQTGKRLMVTELGWGSDASTSFGTGSLEAQAEQLTSAYRAYLRHRRELRLKAVYWFSWSDLPPETVTCSFCRETGLFDVDGRAKPAWQSLLDFTHDI
ncbi:MAG: hypothetical protein KDB62_08215 [Solirubrobacterales bacterium]|nr:hypothetical protein [Solirubrobacterales bacterium]